MSVSVTQLMASKRRDLTLTEKLDLLKRYDALGPISQRNAALKLEISQPLLCKLLKSRKDLNDQREQNASTSRKRSRSGKSNDVEEALLLWFKHVREKNAPITRDVLLTKAGQLASEFGIENFTPTDGWLTRWKNRNNIVYKKMHGESLQSDVNESQRWLSEVLPELLREYAHADIFNADETALYYRATPDATLTFKDDKVSGGKKQKTRVTVLLACNMDGSEKRRPLIIGKSKKPRCLRGVKNLPVEYKANKNAWMTSILFSEFLSDWDRENRRRGRNICLIIDNCTAHSTNIHLTNIKLVFLPANTTALIQPLDQGIIRATKAHYRRVFLQRIMAQIDDAHSMEEMARSVTLLDAIHLVSCSWDYVSAETITNCFRKAGVGPMEGLNDETTETEVSIPMEMQEEEFLSWVNLDSDHPVASEMTDADIAEQVRLQNKKSIDVSSDSEDDDQDENNRPCIRQPPSSKEVYNALQVLRATLDLRGGNGSDFNVFYSLERNVLNLIEASRVQSTLDNFVSRQV